MPAATQNVVHPDEVEPRREGSAEVRQTFGRQSGCDQLEQRIIRFEPGRSGERALGDHQEIVYVASGRGTLELDGGRPPLAPDTGVYIARGESYTVEADEPLTFVSVVTRADDGPAPGARKVTVRFADQPELDASSVRTFRYLVNQDAGCADVTQFLG